MSEERKFLRFFEKSTSFFTIFAVMRFILSLIIIAWVLFIIIAFVPILWIKIIVSIIAASLYGMLFYGLSKSLLNRQKGTRH